MKSFRLSAFFGWTAPIVVIGGAINDNVWGRFILNLIRYNAYFRGNEQRVNMLVDIWRVYEFSSKVTTCLLVSWIIFKYIKVSRTPLFWSLAFLSLESLFRYYGTFNWMGSPALIFWLYPVDWSEWGGATNRLYLLIWSTKPIWLEVIFLWILTFLNRYGRKTSRFSSDAFPEG